MGRKDGFFFFSSLILVMQILNTYFEIILTIKIKSAWRDDRGRHVMLTGLLVMKSQRGGLFPSPPGTTVCGW